MLRSERWAEVVDERAPFLFSQTFRSVTGPLFRPVVFRLLGRPMSCVLPALAEPWHGSRSPRDPGFMNPTGAPEQSGDSGRIVQGIFVLPAGVRECTRDCSP